MKTKQPSASTGWICPRCGYVWAIWVAGCSRCNVPETFTSDSANIRIQGISTDDFIKKLRERVYRGA